MLHRTFVLVLVFGIIIITFMLIDQCQAGTWKVSMSFTHDNPQAVDYFNIYCKTVYQTWEEGYRWSAGNAFKEWPFLEKQEFTTPNLADEIYYCFKVTAVYPHTETRCPILDLGCWECLFIKAEWITISE